MVAGKTDYLVRLNYCLIIATPAVLLFLIPHFLYLLFQNMTFVCSYSF